MTTTDKWNGSGDWEANSSDWSSGVPVPTTPAEIQSGFATISSGEFGEVQQLTIDSFAQLDLDDGAVLNVTDWLANAGTWDLGGGDTVSIGTRLTNSGAINIGGAGITASTTVTAASLVNTSRGNIVLQGNAGPGTTDQATLDITDSNSSIVAGSIEVLGDADLALATGITKVASTGFLAVAGKEARISLGAGSTSNALSGLTYNAGTVDFEGNSGSGFGGTTISTSVGFTNVASSQLGVDFNGRDGGTSVTIGGAFVNEGTADIGNTGLSGSTTVKATTLANNGTLNLQGNASSGTTDKASLILTGAAAATSTGRVQVGGDATLQFGSGGITTIGAGAWLELDGSGAQVLTGSSNGLSGLTANYGTLVLEGGTLYGAGGASLTTTGSFTNYGATYVDGYYGGDGGSAATFGGTLANDGTLDIGNGSLSASTTVHATTLANSGTLNLQGNPGSGTTNKASLVLSGAATATSTGYLRVAGDATIQFATGGVTTVGSGAWLELDGSGAQILSTGGASNGLSGLTANNGTLLLRGNSGYGAGGATMTTTKSFTNYGGFYVDGYNGTGGGSAATFGGAFVNEGTADIGNTGLSAATTVHATTLVNNGTFILQGNASSGTANNASLVLSGGAASTSTGLERISGDATLKFGSGGIATVGSGASLELDGSGAQLLTGASSSLTGLAANYGTLLLRGNSNYGAGGATLATASGTSFTNYGTTSVDSYGDGDGGSAVTFGGTLTNDGTLDIGNGSLSASTTMHATTLVNNGTLNLQGNAASGTSDKASLVLSGAATATSTAYLKVGGDATLQFHSGGITTIASGGSIELDGSGAQILTNGGSSSALSGLIVNDGTLFLRGGSNLGPGGASLTTTKSFTNDGGTYVDGYDGGDGGSSATFGGTLTNMGTFDIGNTALSAATTVTAKALSNDGALNLAGSSSFLAELIVNGAATTDGDVTIGADSKIDVTGSNSFTQAGGSTTVTGSLVASTIDANDGVLDFKTAITGGDGVGALKIGDLGTLEFDAAVDSTHTAAFTAADGTLALGDAGAFSGRIAGFTGYDAIDLIGQAITGLSFSGGRLTVSLSGGGTENLAFSGSYTTASFTFASDGHGGSNILHT
jgi:hypothetical protein